MPCHGRTTLVSAPAELAAMVVNRAVTIMEENAVVQLLLHACFFLYPAWPLVHGALSVSKGGAQPQTACGLLLLHMCSLLQS